MSQLVNEGHLCFQENLEDIEDNVRSVNPDTDKNSKKHVKMNFQQKKNTA